MLQTIGRRIAILRSEREWTQQYLAERLGISRVSISHIEMGLTIPGERTITLMAGLFKVPPHTLVEDTTYPQAKTDRLPLTACSYTLLELDLHLMENDLKWLDMIKENPQLTSIKNQVYLKWENKLLDWATQILDPHERMILQQAISNLNRIRPY